MDRFEMVISKSPYSDDAAALREHERLIRKGRLIAQAMAIARARKMLGTLIPLVKADEKRVATSLEVGSPWSTPEQAPYDAGFIAPAYPGRTSDKNGGSK